MNANNRTAAKVVRLWDKEIRAALQLFELRLKDEPLLAGYYRHQTDTFNHLIEGLTAHFVRLPGDGFTLWTEPKNINLLDKIK